MFQSAAEAVFFWTVLVVYFGGLAVFFVKAGMRAGKRSNDPTPLTIVVLVVGLVIGYLRIGPLPNWLFFPGEVLFIAGCALTLWSYLVLGRYLSAHVQVYADHQIIESGPYRFVRHPGYVGQIVAVVGLGLALQSWVALVVIVLAAGAILAFRIRNEERFLSAELGEPYRSYMRRTKRFVPFLW
jgi:protein-S-isoprenylcysteine O-methyltransferase Ste14